MGVDSTSWVTQFISHTISNEELDSGFRVSFHVDSILVSLHLCREYLYREEGREVSDFIVPSSVYVLVTLRASLSGIFLQGRKDVVNQCLEFVY